MEWYYYVLLALGALGALAMIYWIMRGFSEEEGAYDHKYSKSAEQVNIKYHNLVVHKGWKDFLINGWLPQLPAFWRKKTHLHWDIVLDEEAKYILDQGDQNDINKGGGISYYYWNHHKDSAMWGWNWNPSKNKFQYFFYCHVDGKVVKVDAHKYKDDKEVALRVDSGRYVSIDLYIDHTTKTYKMEFKALRSSASLSTNFNHSRNRSKEITSYFGGNRKAPKRLKKKWHRS